MARKLIADLPSGIGVSKSSNGRGEKCFRVRLGKRFTRGGAAIKKDFPTLEDARTWIKGEARAAKGVQEPILALQKKAGGTAFEVTAAQLAEAVAGVKRLGTAGSIAKAVEFYLKKANPPGGDRTVEEAIEGVRKSKVAAERSERHRKGLGWNLGRFGTTFGKSKINAVRRADIEKWLDDNKVKGTTRRNYIRDLTILFRFALSREWVVDNPMTGIERPDPPDVEIAILGADEVREFLRTAESLNSHLAVALAIKFFAGVRTSELFQLDWADISNNQIKIKGIHAKTRQRRIITVQANLRDWLAAYKGQGAVTTRRDNAWHLDLQQVEETVNTLRRFNNSQGPIFVIPPNVARHCFCSYHLERFQNENLTAAEAGNTPAVIFRNYRALVVAGDCPKYWDIGPR